MDEEFDYYIVDFSECSYPVEMQLALQLDLKLPAFYGRNLSALRDCLTRFMSPCEVTIRGIANRPKTVNEYAGKILKIFLDVEEDDAPDAVELANRRKAPKSTG